MSRKELKQVFEDTRRLYTSDFILKGSIKQSILRQEVWKEGEIERLPHDDLGSHAKIFVSDKTTFSAASQYAREGMRTFVLNFASAKKAGGGTENGAMAQEECLCRISTLYPCLKADTPYHNFYKPHKDNTFLNNADCIYTPNVTVFKSDEKVPKLLPRHDWYTVNIISCAAPNLSHNSINEKQLFDEHVKRAENIIEIALRHSCEALILGAFGCGVFNNRASIVAIAWRDVLKRYKTKLKVVEFAIPKSSNNKNYEVFKQYIK